MDDSKSANLPGYTLLHEIEKEIPPFQRIVVTRESDIRFGVCPDAFRVDYETIISQLRSVVPLRH